MLILITETLTGRRENYELKITEEPYCLSICLPIQQTNFYLYEECLYSGITTVAILFHFPLLFCFLDSSFFHFSHLFSPYKYISEGINVHFTCWAMHIELCCLFWSVTTLAIHHPLAFFYGSSFIILSGQNHFLVLLRQLFWNISKLCSILGITFQCSDPYSNRLFILLLDVCTLTFCFIYLPWRHFKVMQTL